MPRPRPDTSIVKRCSRCKQTLPRSEFYANNRTFDGLANRCKPCNYALHNAWRLRNLPKVRDASKKWREENPRLAKDHRLRSAYGVPLGFYEIALAAQHGKCAICKTEAPGGKGDFHVDHCHDTGAIRGLLCHNCNVGIGNFKHDARIITDALQYLAAYPKVAV